MNANIHILDRKSSDNEYLHKDFHGALCFAIKYLDDNFGPESSAEYLKQVGESYFMPLSAQLKNKGLPALANHFQDIFEKENSRFSIRYENEMLILQVHECPAISHLKKNNQLFTERFCETTVVVNDTICKNAGYSCSCTYEPGQGTCVQKFRKEK